MTQPSQTPQTPERQALEQALHSLNAPSPLARLLLAPLRSPIFAFLLFGSILYLWGPSQQTSTPYTSVISIPRSTLRATYRAAMKRHRLKRLSKAQRQRLKQRFVLDEIFYQEALRHKLGRHDHIVRKRLIQKFLFLSFSRKNPPLTLAQRKAYFARTRKRWVRPGTLRYQHIFVTDNSPTGLQRLKQRASALLPLAEVASISFTASATRPILRPQTSKTRPTRPPYILLEASLPPKRPTTKPIHKASSSKPTHKAATTRPAHKLDTKPLAMLGALSQGGAGQLSSALLVLLKALPIDRWSRPLRTSEGWHLLKVLVRNQPARMSFREAQPLLQAHLLRVRKKRHMRKLLQRLKRRYRVRFTTP